MLVELEVCGEFSSEAIPKQVAHPLLGLRWEGHCSLERISQMIRQLGLPYASVGYLSQRLRAYAKTLPKDVLTGTRIVFLLSDEIFTRGQPILMTVDPKSLAILKIELAQNREAETWRKHGEEMVEAGLIERPTVVSDQGPGLLKGCALMGLTHPPDLFHLCWQSCIMLCRA